MDNWTMNFLRDLQAKRTSYKEMVDFCADSLILSNTIMEEYSKAYCDAEVISGTDYNEETEGYADVFQWYIIPDDAVERFSEYTNEIIYCLPEFDIYLLAVTHYGTSWSGVPANWKEIEEV